MSRGTRAWVRSLAVSTSSPECSGPGSMVLRVRQTVLGDAGLGPRARGVDRCPGRHRPRSEGLRGPQTVPRESGRCPRHRGVDQFSRVTLAHAQGPVGSTTYPGRLPPWSQGPRAQPVLPGHTCLGLRSHVFDPLSSVNRAWVQCDDLFGRLGPTPEGPRVRPAVPGNLVLGPKTCGVHQLSRETRARVQGPAGSTGCPGHLGPGPRA